MSSKGSSDVKYLKVSKVILPAIIGVVVVGWLMYNHFDLSELPHSLNSSHTLIWVGMAALMYLVRHLFYAYRLKHVTDHFFSWLKAIQLIVIWEFSTAVSPTSVGGAGVAFFLLSQEKLSGSRTISAVLYTMVLDTMFFVLALITLYFVIGPVMIRPGMKVFMDIDGYGITFLTVLGFMFLYGSLFFYGLFINPRTIKGLLIFISRWKFLNRFRTKLRDTAYDVVTSAGELKNKPLKFHLIAFGCTAGAWISRFLAINFLIVAFVTDASRTLWDHAIIFSRGMAMHTIEAFSPTPGASGVAEFLFSGFFTDYIPVGISVIIVLVWRLLGYYSYLFAGVLVIPVWLRNVIKKGEE